ncbi:hypothetical protein K501DRAFT_289174 [Backusella circina FSU 941]|nr:hypothetical protein K501DRAFT_289174 [Backusella circina FSU 941]
MLESTDAKKSINLKKIFRHDTQHHQHPSSINRKAATHLNISSPILQHSTSIYSLVSPTRTAFTSIYSTTNSNELPFQLYQPVSPPPPIPAQYITTPNSVSPAPRRQYFDFKEEQDKDQEVHPLDLPPTTPRYDTPSQHLTQQRRNLPPMRNPQVRQTVATDIRTHNDMSETVPTGCVRLNNRRHSCSSTTIYKQPNDNNNNVVTLRKLRERRRSSKVGPTNAASSIEKMMETSKSTPHHKVKTYNLRRAILSPEEVEKQKKIQELEDLITGRRGSTLKLTLTPKVLS